MSSTSQFFASCCYFPTLLCTNYSQSYFPLRPSIINSLSSFSYFEADPPYSYHYSPIDSKNTIDENLSLGNNNKFNSEILHCDKHYTNEFFIPNYNDENINNMFDSIFSKENSKEKKEQQLDESNEKKEEIEKKDDSVLEEAYFPVLKCNEPKYNPASLSIDHDEEICEQHPTCMYELMFNNSANITSHIKFVMDSFDFYRPKNNEPFVFELGCIVIETCDKQMIKPKIKKN